MTVTDKLGHGYGPTYEQLSLLLGPWPTVVEIGTADGDGLRYFREVFSPSLLVGVDYHRTDGAEDAADYFVVSDQAAVNLPSRLRETAGVGSWDLVVDDASHEDGLTDQTLRIMWPVVNPGGVYVIEDWSHANLICGRLAASLTSAFADNPALRAYDLPGLESITYRPGLIVLRKRTDADHV